MSDHVSSPSIGRPRAELLQRRVARDGWLLLLVGLLLPVFALFAAVHGWRLRDADRRAAMILVPAGIAVFVVRMVLWLG
jgi:hypothetical protein